MTEFVFTPRPNFAHKPRTSWPPKIGIVHATRGHTSLDLQDDATVGWFTAGAVDNGGWAPTADLLISADEDKVYVFEQSLFDLVRFQSSYSAGYGSVGPATEWAVDEVGIAIEVAQSDRLEPYSDDIVKRLAWAFREVQHQLNFTLPAVRIPSWDQLRSGPVPSGYIGHEDTANGRKGDKTDPGALFPWARFIAQLADPEGDVGMLTPIPLDKFVGFGRFLGHGFSDIGNDSRVPDGVQGYVSDDPPAPGKTRIVVDIDSALLS